MCAKKTTAAAAHWTGSLLAWLLGPGRPVVLFLCALGLLVACLLVAWHRLRILESPDYRVGPGQVTITPPPAWIHADLVAEVFRDPRLDGSLSIMDDDLLGRMKKVFADQPWVARVVQIEKSHPAAVRVELEYRRPVCMVQVPGGVWAVDAEGVVLPTADFTPNEAARYPLLVGVDRQPASPVGRHWHDARVTGGADIAAAFGPAWDLLRLHRIEPLADDPTGGANPNRRTREPFFVLWTRATATHSGTRILWGYAPLAKMPGEIPAVEKVARLKHFQSVRDSLDDPRNPRHELDARTLDQAGTP
jgi:hypothetical protein